MIFAILLALSFFLHPNLVYAINDPLSVPNNTYGIHVADTNDIADSASLVNSIGGEWGYVTCVIQDNDMSVEKWQEVMNVMRRKHLIPIVRIATHIEGDAWVKPQEHNIAKWVDFLSSLNWPIENRYVVLFNEPNNAKEWGNSLDPEGYGMTLINFSTALKKQSQDFFILPAGFDASAATDGSSMDEETFLKRMIDAHPSVLSAIDGWTSHAYPNPGFSGSPYAYGRGTLTTFIWERDLLYSLGLTKTLPVFITETGWQHRFGKYFDYRLLDPDIVGHYMSIASQTVWNETHIVAVTPFLFNYQDYPFDHFSFKKLGSSDFYSQYDAYRNVSKTKGKPRQRESFSTNPFVFPNELITHSNYVLESEMKNTGQSIASSESSYTLTARDTDGLFGSLSGIIPYLEPGQSGKIRIILKTPNKEGVYRLTLVVSHDDREIIVEEKDITVIPPPSATLNVTLGWNTKGNTEKATVLVYDMKNTLLHKFSVVPVQNGKMTITGLYEIVPEQKYRVVILVPYYLPRQEIVTMKSKQNTWTFKRLYPFDFNRDGKLTVSDVFVMVVYPPFSIFRIFLAR